MKKKIYLLIFTVISLSACKNNPEVKGENNKVDNVNAGIPSPSNNISSEEIKEYNEIIAKETSLIKNIVERLNEDYKEILTQEDMVVHLINEEREEYINLYQRVLDKMHYVTKEFKEKLVQEIRDVGQAETQSEMRANSDPLFKSEISAEEIVILGSDVEEDEGIVIVQLEYPLIKLSCCQTTLVFSKIDEEWMLSGRIIDVGNRKVKFIEVDNLVGLYHKDDNHNFSYSIDQEGKKYVLKHCTPDCQVVGEIEDLEFKGEGHILNLKNSDIEQFPTFNYIDNTLHVREFNEKTSEWKESVFKYEEGQG